MSAGDSMSPRKDGMHVFDALICEDDAMTGMSR